MEEPAEDSWKEALRSYVIEHGDSLDFTKHFWKGCESLQVDLAQYSKFARAIQLSDSGEAQASISLDLETSLSTVKSWCAGSKMPKLGHYLKAFIALGPPKEGLVWLNTECTHGHAIPIGRFLQVPLAMGDWADLENVLSQLRPLPGAVSDFDPRYLFGFLLGMVIGDGSKSKQKTAHRHIGLVLSMKYSTNLALGDFTCVCAKSIGLRMGRSRDLAKPKGKPHAFFQWTSQSSPLIDWLHNVALGLREGEVTTYNPIRADWILTAPAEFRVGLVQGLSESDGSPSVASQSMELWIGPNWDLMIRFLGTFGLRAFKCREAITLAKSQAIKSFDVPLLAPQLNTVRYQKLRLLATTRRLKKEERLSPDLRKEIMDLTGKGFSVPKIVEWLAENKGILVSFEAAQRWKKKYKMQLSSNEETSPSNNWRFSP